MSSARRLLTPPFARQLAPFRGVVHIECGSRGWKSSAFYRDQARADAAATVVYPADKAPRLYQWPVRNCSVVVWGRDSKLERCAELVVCLIDAGALAVSLVHEDLERGWAHYNSDRPASVA